MFELPTVERLASRAEELQQAALLEELESSGEDVEALIERISAMPESAVSGLVKEMRTSRP